MSVDSYCSCIWYIPQHLIYDKIFFKLLEDWDIFFFINLDLFVSMMHRHIKIQSIDLIRNEKECGPARVLTKNFELFWKKNTKCSIIFIMLLLQWLPFFLSLFVTVSYF